MAAGLNAIGIELIDDNDLNLSGSVSVQGNDAQAIALENGNTLTISGNVSATGDAAHGIEAQMAGNNMNITGQVTTSGSDTRALNLNDGNRVSLSGEISSTGASASGIAGADGNTITISGSVRTSGLNSRALSVEDSNTINVLGSLTSSGDNAHALVAGANNQVTVSGQLTAGEGGDAIRFEGANNRLTLTGDVQLQGNLTNLGSNTELVIEDLSGQVVAWQFDPRDLVSVRTSYQGTSAYSSETGLFVTYDEAALTSAMVAPVAALSAQPLRTPGSGWVGDLYSRSSKGQKEVSSGANFSQGRPWGDFRFGVNSSSFADESASSSVTSAFVGAGMMTDSLFNIDGAIALSFGQMKREVNSNTASSGVETLSSDGMGLALNLQTSRQLSAFSVFGRPFLVAVDGGASYAYNAAREEEGGAGAASLDASHMLFLDYGGELSTQFGATQVFAGLDGRYLSAGEIRGTLADQDTDFSTDGFNSLRPYLGVTSVVDVFRLRAALDMTEGLDFQLSAGFSF